MIPFRFDLSPLPSLPFPFLFPTHTHPTRVSWLGMLSPCSSSPEKKEKEKETKKRKRKTASDISQLRFLRFSPCTFFLFFSFLFFFFLEIWFCILSPSVSLVACPNACIFIGPRHLHASIAWGRPKPCSFYLFPHGLNSLSNRELIL